jgi:2-aminoadipate transaminase
MHCVDCQRGVRLGSWTRHATRSALQDALRICGRPGVISFSLGLPATELLPANELEEACIYTLANNRAALQYGQPCPALKTHIVSLMRMRGVECTEGQIFLTNGAQQALSLLVKLLLNRRGSVIAEEVSYPGFQQIVQFYRAEILAVSADPNTGMEVDEVEWQLSRGIHPAFIYTIPNGHNPLGINLSIEKRHRLLAVSQRYAVPIIEEDPYGFLSYDCMIPPLRAQCDDAVFYVGSFSKIITPSFRVGWIVVPVNLVSFLDILKESSDLNVASFSQYVIARLLDSGFLSSHLRHLQSEYSCRRDAMLTALSDEFPTGSRWARPECGVYIWVRLPQNWDTMRLLEVTASSENVVFMPGSAFSPNPSPLVRASMRLNFSHPSIEHIKEGVHRLSSAVQSYHERHARTDL